MTRLRKDLVVRALPLVLLFIIGLFSAFICFSMHGYYILGGDLYYPLEPSIDVYRIPFAWDARYAAGGTSEARHIPSFLYFLFFFVLDKLSIPLAVSQKIALFGIFSLTAPAMYYLMLVIVRDLRGEIKPRDRLAAFIAGFFYNFNLWNLFNLASPSVHLELSYLAAPLVLAFFLKGLRGSAPLYLSLIAILYAAISPAASNPIYTLNTIWPVGFFVAFLLIRYVSAHDKTAIYRTVIFSLFALVVFILVNLWWLLPMYETLNASVSTIERSGNIWGWLDWKSARSSFLNIFRLTSHEAWSHSKPGDLIIAAAKTYETNPVFILVSFLFLSIAFLSLISRKRNFYTLYFSTMAVVMIFMAKGAHAPLVFINQFLHQKILVLTFYRSVEWYTPMIVLSYAYLLGEGSSLAYGLMNSYGKVVGRGFLALLFTCLIVFNYPFWTGKVVHQGQKTGEIANPYFVKIPSWYFESARWINEQPEDFRIVSAPSLAPYYHTDWGFSGGELGIFLYDKPIINNIFGWDNVRNISSFIIEHINGGTSDQNFQIDRLLALLNIKYITLRNDVADWSGGMMVKIGTMHTARRLMLQHKIALEKSFGKLDFYKIFDQYFLPHIYSAAVITPVYSDINVLMPLTYTSYLAGYPALAFTEQQNRDSLQSLVNDRQLVVNNQILFAYTNFNDMVIDLARTEVEVKGDRGEVGQRLEVRGDRQETKISGQKRILVKLNKKGKGKFTVEDKEMYEIWINNSEVIENEGWELKVKIDGEALEDGEWGKNNKWIKIGEVSLDKGKHGISVRSQGSGIRNQHKEEFKKLIQDLEVMIIPKGKLEEYRKILSQKPVRYFFYIDREKIENMLKDDRKLEEIKLKGVNPFKIDKQQFYIPEDGNYSFEVLIKPKRDFLEDNFVRSSSSIKAALDMISGWETKVLNASYKQTISENGMHIDAYFQGRGDVKEGIILIKKFSNINIKERPYLVFSYDIKNSEVQAVELDIKFNDLNSRFSKTKNITLKIDNKQYAINLFQMVKNTLGKEIEDALFVDEVVIRFKKKDGMDLSEYKKRETYSFIFKNIAFLKTQPIVGMFEDRLLEYLPDKYYYFDTNGELKNVDLLVQVPWDIKDIYKLHMQKFIDLKETPVLSLNFTKPAIENNMDGERSNFPGEWKVVMGLDFDGDEKEDDIMETFVPDAGVSDGKLLLTVRSYEEAKKRFPDKRNYHLLSIGISHPDGRGIFYQTVIGKKLIRYREHIYKSSDFRAGADVLDIDGKIYNLAPSAVNQKENNSNNWIQYNNIFLTEGEHYLNVLENDRFTIEMVEIKPVSSQQSAVSSRKPPEIEFKKINPTRYIVDVKRAKEPFALVFSESFHEGWKAYVRQKVMGERRGAIWEEPWSALWSAWKDGGKRVEIKEHFVVNGYANGWIVQAGLKAKGERQRARSAGQEAIGEDFEILLEYNPQRLFEVGLMISGVTLIGCIGYLGYEFARRKSGIDA